MQTQSAELIGANEPEPSEFIVDPETGSFIVAIAGTVIIPTGLPMKPLDQVPGKIRIEKQHAGQHNSVMEIDSAFDLYSGNLEQIVELLRVKLREAFKTAAGSSTATALADNWRKIQSKRLHHYALPRRESSQSVDSAIGNPTAE